MNQPGSNFDNDLPMIKAQVDLHDLAAKLNLKREGKGNYHGPNGKGNTPSLSISADGRSFKDFSDPDNREAGGDCFALVKWCQGVDFKDALQMVRDWYGFERPPRRATAPAREETFEEFLASRARKATDKALRWLVDERKIVEAVAQRAITRGAVGFDDWTNPKIAPNEPLHGGPGAVFVVRSLNPGRVVAVDYRFFDPALNGGLKTKTMGAKFGHVWTADMAALKAAHTVTVVESPINALSVDSLERKGFASVATRGTNVAAIDWTFLVGKQVVICMDYDAPDRKGRCAGQETGWKLYELLTALNIPAQLVDQIDWAENGWNDVNDVIQQGDVAALRPVMKTLEKWAIAGLPGKLPDHDHDTGKSRVFLPAHDFERYWKYRVEPDFTRVISISTDEDGGERTSFNDVAGFRIAALSRVTVAGTTSAMTGEIDTAPSVLFAATVQTPRMDGEKRALTRRVIEDDSLHSMTTWEKFGPVFKPSEFKRLLSILERTSNLGARKAVNFVGVAWRDGKLIVSEGPDCYFRDERQQCTYHNLTFPRGPVSDAARVMNAYATTFKDHAALRLMVWGLGGHLKALLGFWPHMVLQAKKGSGKTVLLKRLERTMALKVLSGQSLQTEFRLLTSVSYTSHPIGWEELSARSKKVITSAVSLLQECYQYSPTYRNTQMLDFLQCAPVLLAGEDVPVDSLLQKTVQVDLSGRKGPLMPEDLPVFPVQQWLEFITQLQKPAVIERFAANKASCILDSRAAPDDDGANRMAENYAAVLTCWQLLQDFAGAALPDDEFTRSLKAEMNRHIAGTTAAREPWVWILERLFTEIDAGNYKLPITFEAVAPADGGVPRNCLLLRTSHAVNHLSSALTTKEWFDTLPIKSDRVLKQALKRAGVVTAEGLERKWKNRRVSNLVALDLDRLREYHLSVSEPSAEFVHDDD